MGLFYFFTGIGSFLGGILINSFKSVIYSSRDNDDINCSDCHLNYYFYTLAGIQLIGMIIFVVVDSNYKIVKIKEDSQRPSSGSLEVDPLLNTGSSLLNANNRNYGSSNTSSTNNKNQINISNSNNQNFSNFDPVNS